MLHYLGTRKSADFPIVQRKAPYSNSPAKITNSTKVGKVWF